MSNIVAIVGRPNVGKSTIFNRLTESRQAITDEISGVTRDRHYGKVEWNGREFSIIDTGGYVQGSDDIFESEIRKQVELAIDEANVILFLVDAKTGITDLDQAVVKLLRKSNKEIVLAVNKVGHCLDPGRCVYCFKSPVLCILDHLKHVAALQGVTVFTD